MNALSCGDGGLAKTERPPNQACFQVPIPPKMVQTGPKRSVVEHSRPILVPRLLFRPVGVLEVMHGLHKLLDLFGVS